MNTNEYIFDLRDAINKKDASTIKQIVKENNLEIIDGKIFEKDKKLADNQTKYYDQLQMIKKILLNSFLCGGLFI